MEQKKLEKDLIFYSPGQKGAAFVYKSGYFVDTNLISQTVDHLQYETENMIKWVEDRRSQPRVS